MILTKKAIFEICKRRKVEKVDRLVLAIGEVKKLARSMNRWKTYHAIDDAEKVCGWELADILKGVQKVGDKK